MQHLLESSSYSKWYKSHRRFSFTANYCIELYEEEQKIPDIIFRPFLRNLSCHSKAEEKMFQTNPEILQEHSKILLSKSYSNEEKYSFCKSLLLHMKEEEEIISASLVSSKPYTCSN